MRARRNEQYEKCNKQYDKKTSPVVIDQDPKKFAWLIDEKPVTYNELNGFFSQNSLLPAYYITTTLLLPPKTILIVKLNPSNNNRQQPNNNLLQYVLRNSYRRRE